MKKVFKWTGNLILSLLIIVVFFSFLSSIQAKKNPGHIPSIMGYKIMTVLSGSMRPVLEPGDMIVAKEVDAKDIQIEDVITYKINESTLVTHRVTEKIEEDGRIMFKTKGDANNTKDSYLILPDQLVGVLVFNIPKGGYFANFIRSPLGFATLIILPILYLLVGEVKTILSRVDEGEQRKEHPNPGDNMEK